jgi:ribonuclease PH
VMVTRSSNRSPLQTRPISIVRGFTSTSPGSVLVAYGRTRVLVTASIEDRVPRHLVGQDGHGWLTAEYAMLPGATGTRNHRERLKVGGRTQEIQRLIGRSLRASLDLTRLGQHTITLDADVLQADGGTRVAAITGAYVAMADALSSLEALHQASNRKQPWVSPIVSPVAALSVGLVNGQVMVDLDYNEDACADVDANLVMNANGDFVEVQFTSEGRPFSRSQLDAMMDAATPCLYELLALQQQALSQPQPDAALHDTLAPLLAANPSLALSL